MMVQSRVYRPDIHCPAFGSNWMRKNGFTNGSQAYRCGDCKRGYAPCETCGVTIVRGSGVR